MKHQSQPFRLDGRSIVVIGAGAGIGRATALACADAGAHVHCWDLERAAAEATQQEIRERGGAASAACLDVVDGDAVERAFESLSKGPDENPPLGGVVATPGVNVRKPILEYTSEEFERVVAVNLRGALNVLRGAGRALVDQGGGSIVLFSSIRSQVVEPGQGVYAATKAGIVQMVRALAAELGPRGVRVNAVAPGVVETPLTRQILDDPDWAAAYANKSALGRWAKPAEMAGPTVFLLSDAASYVTGSLLFVDGGWTAVDGRFTPPGM